ncbi:MAG: hypothetical protein Q9163_000160 [Psora crenata]
MPHLRNSEEYELVNRESFGFDEGLDLDEPDFQDLGVTSTSYTQKEPLSNRVTNFLYSIIPRRTRRKGHRKPPSQTSAKYQKRLIAALVVLIAVFQPSYTNPPKHYQDLRRAIEASKDYGRANLENQKVFIAASIYDEGGYLLGGAWGEAVLQLVDMLGNKNVYLSIYENESGANAQVASINFKHKVQCKHSVVYDTNFAMDEVPHVRLPDGSERVKRIAYLAEVRNRALLPLEEEPVVQYDKILYLNDVMFDPVEAAQLLLSTNIDEHGDASYRAACAVDFINPFKFYDTFATRDLEGYSMGIPFFPWFTGAGKGISRLDVLRGRDAVRVKSCWGGMVAFDARAFQAPEPLRFRASPDLYWEASECCLIHADLMRKATVNEDGNFPGIFMNPFVRVAYSQRTFRWLHFTRRFERLYTIPHSIINSLVGLPWFNPRRNEVAGTTVVEEVWVPDSSKKDGGSFEKQTVEAQGDGFCGIRTLQLIKEAPRQGGSQENTDQEEFAGEQSSDSSPAPASDFHHHHQHHDTPKTPGCDSPPNAGLNSPDFQPRPYPGSQGLMPPHNTPLTIPVRPKPIAEDGESPVQSPTAVGDALYEYVQSIDGVPLSESMWAPQNISHRQSIPRGPRPSSQDLTAVEDVESKPAIHVTSSRMSQDAADARRQAPWPTATGEAAAKLVTIENASSGVPLGSAFPPDVSLHVPTALQRSAAVLKQMKQEKRKQMVERTAQQEVQEQPDQKAANVMMEDVCLRPLPNQKPAKNEPGISPVPVRPSASGPIMTKLTAIPKDTKQYDQSAMDQTTESSYLPPHLRHKVPTSPSVGTHVNPEKTLSPSKWQFRPTQQDDNTLPTDPASPRVKESPLPAGLLDEWGPKERPTGAERPLKEPTQQQGQAPSISRLPPAAGGAAGAAGAAAITTTEATSIGISKSKERVFTAAAAPTDKVPGLEEDAEDRERQIVFTSWGTPVARDRAAARIRKVILKGLPRGVTPAFVASLIFGGPLEQIYVRDNDTATVKFLHAADCQTFYDDTSNGLVYGREGNGREQVVWVSLAKDVDVVGGLLNQWISSNCTRCVRAVPVEEGLGKEYLWRMASRNNRSVEGIEDGRSPGGVSSRYIIFRFTEIAHAVQFRSTLSRDDEWEHCNVTYAKDP